MTTVLALQAYRDWFDRLTDVEAAAVQNVVHKLEQDGLNLGAPHSSAIKGARHALRELRPKQADDLFDAYLAWRAKQKKNER